MDAFAAHRAFTAGLDMVDVGERQAPCLFMVDRECVYTCSATLAAQVLALRAALASESLQGARSTDSSRRA